MPYQGHKYQVGMQGSQEYPHGCEASFEAVPMLFCRFFRGQLDYMIDDAAGSRDPIRLIADAGLFFPWEIDFSDYRLELVVFT